MVELASTNDPMVAAKFIYRQVKKLLTESMHIKKAGMIARLFLWYAFSFFTMLQQWRCEVLEIPRW